MGILDGLMQELGAGGLGAIAGKLGVDQNQAQGALQSALPLIVGALARNTANPEGAQSLQNALQQHANTGSVRDQVQQVTSQAGTSSDASAILGHIFGNKQDVVAQGVAQTSEVDSNQAGALIGMLAPLVMGYLGRQAQQNNLDANQISSTLGQQAQEAESSSGIGGLVTAVLDKDGDGGLDLSDLISAGSGLLGAFRK